MDFKAELKLLLAEQNKKRTKKFYKDDIFLALSKVLHRMELIYPLVEYCGARDLHNYLVADLTDEKMPIELSWGDLMGWITSKLMLVESKCTAAMYTGAVRYAVILLRMLLLKGAKK